MSGLKKTTTFGDIYEVRGFDVYDIETKTKVLSADKISVCAFLGLRRGTNLRKYVQSKSKRHYNGKCYAIRFASTK
jgi:hypothetical protein